MAKRKLQVQRRVDKIGNKETERKQEDDRGTEKSGHAKADQRSEQLSEPWRKFYEAVRNNVRDP